MAEEELVGAEQVEEPAAPKVQTVTEEFKVQAQDLFQTINNVIREGTARRVQVLRHDRILVDIPLAVGVGAGVVLAFYMPVLSAIAGVAALLTGCTVRIEREVPPA